LPRSSLAPSLAFAMLAALGAAPLSGCLVAAVGAGAGTGYAVTSQERSLGQTANDAGIQAVIGQSWKQYNIKLADDLSMTVYEGRVLITGTVPSEDWRAEAVKRAWQADGVKEVYDEIQVGSDEGFMQDVGDDTITSKLKTQLVGDGDVRSLNYTVTTVKGVVYIIGTARSAAEEQRVIDHARNIADVKRVVSYIRIRSGEPQKPETASGAPPASAAAAPGPAAASDAPERLSPPTPRQQIDVQPLQ
jgi:osmotically-inducible protein OsmY